MVEVLAPLPTAPLSVEAVRRAPKVLLHDHLDGGLRPRTLVELAAEVGYQELPSAEPDELGVWFRNAADSGSLERYLETFAHTVGVMQTGESLTRVAAECAVDLALDGVVYAEVRFAPELHVERGLTLPEVVDAVLAGFEAGSARVSSTGHPIRVGTLLTAMRHTDRSQEIAELVIAYRDAGVVGFDIAGPELGFPPARHLAAFEYVGREHGHITIHAGEAVGLSSIDEAVHRCGAERLGHGVRIVDDLIVGEVVLTDSPEQESGSRTVTRVDPVGDDGVRLGQLAMYLRDQRIPLELCPSSNVQTGAAASIATHPIRLLDRLGFRVTVNTDNRLMSGTSMSREFTLLSEAFGYGWDDLERFTVNAMASAFLPLDQRARMIRDMIRPGYAALRASD